MKVPCCLHDAWEEFVDGCGPDAPARTKEKLRALIADAELVFTCAGAVGNAEAWGRFYTVLYETNWAWDSAVTNGAVIYAYAAATVRETLASMTPEQKESLLERALMAYYTVRDDEWSDGISSLLELINDEDAT